jgi:hypothetical protein
VVVASVPTLGRSGSGRIGRLDPDQFYLIVVDEAHHATAETYRRTLEHFGVFEPDTKRLLVGFTATPKRGDGQGLDGVFEEIAFSRALPEMVRTGYLAPLAAYRVETDVDLSGVRTRLGDFVTSQLSRAVNVQERNDLVVRIYLDRLGGRQTLCFCVDVAHARHLAEAFRETGVPAAAVTGETSRPEREASLLAFREGRLRVLTNCMVLTEGYDEPSVSGILLARPTKSTLLYTQMIGRGTRLHPGKADVTVVDIVDASRSHRLVTLPTLFGLPADFDLAGHTTAEAWDAFRWAEANRPWVRTDLAASLEDLRYRCTKVDLFDLETPEELAPCTRLAWASLGSGGYRLGLPGGDAVIVSRNILGQWEAVRRRGATEEVVARAADPRRVVQDADAFVESHCAEAAPLLYRHGRWRREPASDRQLQLLRERKIQAPPGLTKGQASHLIGMLPRR